MAENIDENLNEERSGPARAWPGPSARAQRIYIRVTPQEKAELRRLAAVTGFGALATYMREKGLSDGITPTETNALHWEWLAAINRIGTEMDDIAAHLTNGREPDEEMLLLVMQLHELAQETWREAKAKNGLQARND